MSGIRGCARRDGELVRVIGGFVRDVGPDGIMPDRGLRL